MLLTTGASRTLDCKLSLSLESLTPRVVFCNLSKFPSGVHVEAGERERALSGLGCGVVDNVVAGLAEWVGGSARGQDQQARGGRGQRVKSSHAQSAPARPPARFFLL